MNKVNFFSKWYELDVQLSGASNTYTTFFSANNGNPVYLSNNKENIRRFYIEFSAKNLENYTGLKVAGIKITVEKNINIDSSKLYLVFENENSELDEAFVGFSCSLISNIEHCIDDFDTLNTIERTLIDYKTFFSFKKSLTKECEQGLVAELLFLDRLVNINPDYINCWYGPLKNKRDFLFKNSAVEIKSIKNQSQKIITISNENQLTSEHDIQLFLNLYIFEERENAENINNLIKKISNNLTGTNKSQFISKLLLLGVDPNTFKSKYSFFVENIFGYEINEEFPKITKTDIPTEAYDVKYKLNISNVESKDIEMDELVYE